jgi:long-chain acyl-CoA synthetase
MQNLADLLRDTAARLPRNLAVSDGGRTLTYEDLWQEVCTATVRLEAAGIGTDLMVGLQLGNSAAFIVLIYALWRRGAVVVPIPAELRETERAELIRSMDLAAVVSGGEPLAGRAAKEIEVLGTVVRVCVLHERRASIKETVHAALVRFTSGTTSANKGVVLSHEGIIDRITAANRVLEIGPGDTVLWCLPMVHHFVVTIILYLRQGAGLVLVRHAVAGEWLEDIARNRITVLYASPFHYDALSRDTSGKGLPSVRLAVSTTTALSAETAHLFFDRYGLHLVQAYGIIELGLACINRDDPAGRPTSVGRPVPGFSLRLANADNYAGLGDDYGEIEVSGPGFFAAYYHPWRPASEVMSGPWFHTGDVGRIDRDGYLFLYSRVNSVINIAGMKVFPEEIEQVLDGHGSVKESRAYAARHAHLGEVVEAEVVLRQDAGPVSVDDLRGHCAQRLSSFKVPNRIRFVDRIDRTLTTCKIKRRAALGEAP